MISATSQNLIILLPIIISFIISFIILFYTFFEIYLRRRKSAVINVFLFIIFLSSLWSFAYFFDQLSFDLKTKTAWIKIEYFPITFVGAAWLSMALIYTSKERFLRRYGWLIWLLPIFSYIFILTNEYHRLFFARITLEEVSWGPLWWGLHTLVSYVYVVFGILIYLRHLFRVKQKMERNRTLILIFGALVAILGNAVYIFLYKTRIIPFPFDPVPIFVSFSGVIFAFGLFRFKLFEIIPLVVDELLKSLTTGVVIVDLDNEVIDANPAAQKLLLKAITSLKGRNFLTIDSSFHRQNRKKIERLYQKIKLKPKQSFKEEAIVFKPKEQTILAHVSAVQDKKENVLGYLYLFDDISEQIERQKTIEKLNQILRQEKENLERVNLELKISNKKIVEAEKMHKKYVSIAIHELQSPVTEARWTLEMLKNGAVGKISEKQKKFLENLYLSNLRLKDMVDELREISRIDEERFSMKITRCSLEELIDRVLIGFSTEIKSKGLKFLWSKPKKPQPKVIADCSRIVQVLENILSNAVKFTPKKGRIEVILKGTALIAPQKIVKKYGLRQKSEEYLQCSVQDTGMGIPPKEQEKMFSRFFRASNAEKAEIKGTGLGMYITKQIIDRLSGAIWFESEEERGTTFHFTLPTAAR